VKKEYEKPELVNYEDLNNLTAQQQLSEVNLDPALP
jgi:hypothetical protein